MRVGVVVDGVFHWRAYSLTSDPDRPDGCLSITPKLVEAGKVTPYLVHQARPGDIVRLGGVEGDFVLPSPLPEKLLYISAGSGVTPIMSMLRALDHRGQLDDAFHAHSARAEDEVIFGDPLTDHWEAEADLQRLHVERFQPKLGLAEEGEGGRIVFAASGAEAQSDGS